MVHTRPMALMPDNLNIISEIVERMHTNILVLPTEGMTEEQREHLQALEDDIYRLGRVFCEWPSKEK